MAYRQVNYQKEAVEKLITQSKLKLMTAEIYRKNNQEFEDKELQLHAPVASGKTIMSGIYMETLLEEFKTKAIAFVWLSTGKGELHIQSKRNMASALTNVNQMDLQDALNKGYLEGNDAIYVNWESLRNTDNIARREDSFITIDSVIENSNVDHIIVMIDEAHDSRYTEKAEEVINIFNPSIVLNITATPKNIEGYSRNNIISIPIEDVISEGFVKKNVIINEDLASTDRDTILNKAIEKQKQLAELYNTYLEFNYTPLCLIQIENDKTRDDDGNKVSNAEFIKNKLISLGIPNSKIAVWVGNEAECQNKENIQESDVEYLIFKQSIATGWDCPRSHILVRFREVKSVSFDIQTVGRILRTLEKVHYENTVLDNSYIFTEYDDIEVTNDMDKNLKSMIVLDSFKADIKPEFLAVREQLKIPMLKKKSTLRTKINVRELYEGLNGHLRAILSPLEVSESRLFRKVVKGQVSTKELLREALEDELETEEVPLSEKDLRREYITFSKGIYPKYKVGNIVNKVLNEVFVKEIAEDVNFIYKLVLSNKREIEMNVMSYIKEYEATKVTSESSEEIFEIPLNPITKYANTVTSKNYLYTKEPNLDVKYTKSSSEEQFGFLLRNSRNVKAWFKNGTSSQDFSITYQVENENGVPELKEYYPDFIILTEDNKLIILDVKSPSGKKDFANIKQKYYAGKQYELTYKETLISKGFSDVVVSMCKLQDGYFKYCTSTVFEEDTTTSSWIDLEF